MFLIFGLIYFYPGAHALIQRLLLILTLAIIMSHLLVLPSTIRAQPIPPPGFYLLQKIDGLKISATSGYGYIIRTNNTYYIIIGSKNQVIVYDPVSDKLIYNLTTRSHVNLTIGFNDTAPALLIITYTQDNETIYTRPYLWINGTDYVGREVCIPSGYRLSRGFKLVNDTIVYYFYRLDILNENFSTIILEWSLKNNSTEIIIDEGTAYLAVNALVPTLNPRMEIQTLSQGSTETIVVHEDEVRARFISRISLSYGNYKMGLTLTNALPDKTILVDHGNKVLALIIEKTLSLLGREAYSVHAYLMGIYRELYEKSLVSPTSILISLDKLLIINSTGDIKIYDIVTGRFWRSVKSIGYGQLVILPDINGDGGQEVLIVDKDSTNIMSLASLFIWSLNTSLSHVVWLGCIDSNRYYIVALRNNTLDLFNISYLGPRDNTPPDLQIKLRGNNGVSRALDLNVRAVDNDTGVVLIKVEIRDGETSKTIVYHVSGREAVLDIEESLPDGRYVVVVTAMNLVGLNTTVQASLIIDHCPPRSSLY